ncbi:MAG TPA: hypothetical protein VKN99_27935 [Polyangia bacterium]|nr:hypothetical protein [Polyangia bacterium]
MTPSERTLMAAARRAYEWGRLRAALRAAWLVVPMVAISVAWARHPVASLAAGVALLGLVVVLGWRGGAAGRAVGPGLVAGLAPLTLPLAVRTTGHLCSSTLCMQLCLPACVVGGLISGALLARAAARLERGRPGFMVAAGAIAALAGSLGCALLGLSGVAGMAAGLMVASTPAWLLWRTR